MDHNGQDYEMVPTNEWQRNDHSLPRVQVQRPSARAERLKNYDDIALDADWFPILRDKLTPKYKDNFNKSGQDEGDHGSPRSPRTRITVQDEIDGRGTFNAKDLELELYSMHREELQNQLGISWYKIRDIIRRSDINGDGVIEYGEFLQTVRRYRLNTEQASTLKSLVRAFAYAEEFTCWPPRWFMISITLIETAFFAYHSVHLSTQHGIPITWDGPVPYCSMLIYNPNRRWEAWRFLTYMFVHIGITHFVFNMIMQILVGVFLEMQQDGWQGELTKMIRI